MIAILNSLAFSLLISASSGLISGCFFSLWSGDLMNCLMLEWQVFPVVILFGCSYSLSPLDGCREPHILSSLPSVEMPQCGLGEECFPLLAVLGFLIKCCCLVPWGWLDDVTPTRKLSPFTLEGSPLGCKDPRESWMILWIRDPSPTPSLMEPPTAVTAVFRGGSEVLSYPVPAPLSGAPASPPSVLWLPWPSEDFCAFRVFSVGMWLLLFVVCWRGESPGQVHSAMTLTSV